MQDIKELNLVELKKVLKGWQEEEFRAGQVFSWIYKKGGRDFETMSNLPSGLRLKLKENFSLGSLKLLNRRLSADGTEKFLFGLADKGSVEVVSIPTENRVTGCISTQVGCKFVCSFCASGLHGFKRNLSVAEILEQALFLKDCSKAKKLTHLVFMGTGEPLDNYDNLLKSIRIINSKDAFNIGARRITISTCGIIPGIKRLSGEGLQIELSVSLHASDDKTRSRIMPINKRYPLKALLETCREYIKKTDRQVTFEYVLIQGLNSDLQSSRELVRILRGLICKVNLIPANFVKELRIAPPNKPEALYFRDSLLKAGINAILRKPRGQDIEAACGQLRLKHVEK
ncbi:MAG: 23S rRNA (adenine(2503)-C(2))-methyltransferase RlmN [Candidatus Omnitrophota bacterium]